MHMLPRQRSTSTQNHILVAWDGLGSAAALRVDTLDELFTVRLGCALALSQAQDPTRPQMVHTHPFEAYEVSMDSSDDVEERASS